MADESMNDPEFNDGWEEGGRPRETRQWRGGNQQYTFETAETDRQSWPDLAGIFIFAVFDEEEGSWKALYIESTDSLRASGIPKHAKWDCVREFCANGNYEVGLFYRLEKQGPDVRREEYCSLIDEHLPPCQAQERVHRRRPSAVARATGPREGEDRERRYYTDDEFRSYLTASQLKRLSSKEQIAHMVGWFNRMYEDPIQETPYDSEDKGYLYVWGGPFNARDELWDEFGDLVSDDVIQAAVSEVEGDGTIEWAPTGSNPKHRGGPDEDEEDSYEPVPPTLEEIRQRRANGVTAKFGDPDEARGRKALRIEIARLRDAMEDERGRHGGIGHNRPPESLSLSDEQTEEVAEAVKEIDREAAKPAPDVDAVVKSTGRLRKVLGWFGRKLDMAVDSFAKTFGAVTGRAAGILLVGLVASVFLAILNWLDVVLPLF